MSAIFYDDEILVNYEEDEQWEKSVEYLSSLAMTQFHEKSILYRFAAQSWYVLTFWDCCISKDKLNRAMFEKSLKTAYLLARERWWIDSDCLWLFGYFMCINQMVFPYISTDITEVEHEGNSLICRAYSNNPKNKLAEILYLADNENEHKYSNAIRKLKKHLAIYFPNHSAVEQYFTEIFTETY